VNRLRELEQQVLEAMDAGPIGARQGASPRVCRPGMRCGRGSGDGWNFERSAGSSDCVYCGYSVALRAWITPVRLAWGLSSLSCELAARLIEVGSYECRRCGGSPISDAHGLVRRGKRDLKLSADSPKPSEAAFSLVIMMDGWLARTRGVDWGAGPRRKEPERVAWCEIKSAVI
jgi:hypothetical protein